MQASMEKLEHLLELGGIKKDITLLVISGVAVICSLLQFQPLPFDMAWLRHRSVRPANYFGGNDRTGHRFRY